MDPDALDLAPRTLAGLAHQRWPDALASVAAIHAALAGCHEPARLGAIAAALPREVAGLAPELALALARLALALAEHLPGVAPPIPAVPRLPDDLDRAEPAVARAWLQLRLITLVDPAALDTIDDHRLATALEPEPGWSLLAVEDPLPLLLRMARADRPSLRAKVPASLASLVEALALTGERALACLRPLVHDPDVRVRRALFTTLREPWLAARTHEAREPLVELVRAGLDDDDPSVLTEALALGRTLGLREHLLALACDEQRSTFARTSALAGLGELASEHDLALALELAAAEPLAFGGPARRMLLDAHRHGAFVRAPLLPALLDAFDHHLGWTGEDLVRVAWIARVALLDRLAALAPDDPRWLRRSQILAAATGTSAPQLCASLLRRTSEPAIAAALATAAAQLPEFDDEAALLDWLDRIPETLIPILRIKGRADAAARLRARVLDPDLPSALRPSALAALWAIADDRETLQRELAAALGPWASGLFEASHAEVHADPVAAIVLDPPWPDRREYRLAPFDLLRLACGSGDPRLRPTITRLFRGCVETIVAEALAGEFAIKRQKLPELEQQLYRYGRALLAAGRSVRPYLDAASETGRDLVLAILIEWLREQPEPPIAVALLEMIGRHDPRGPALQQILGWWRHRDPEVQRAAIEAMIAGESSEPLRGLELSLARLSEASDPRILRQALAAVARLDARWAEPLVIAALQRPEMAIKKEAATTLATIGGPRCIAALVEWIARHNNPGLRTSLLAALEFAAGRATPAILVDALAEAPDARSRALLHEAIAGRVSLAAALRLARSSQADPQTGHPPSHQANHHALVEAMIRGEVHLRDASATSFAAALHRARLRPLAATPAADPLRRLRVEGFSPAAALALLDDPDHPPSPEPSPELLALVEASLAAWLTWLETPSEPEPPILALALVMRATKRGHTDAIDRVLALVERRGGEALSLIGPLVAFVTECLVASRDPRRRARGLALIRACPPSPTLGGLARHRLLGQLGGVRTPADLDACLSACRIGPDFARDSAALLCEAFAIVPRRPDEILLYGEAVARERELVREQARDWYRLAPTEARAWLADMLARRPLDVPRPTALPFAHGPAFVPRTRADLERLLGQLASDDESLRERSAMAILAWSDTRAVPGAWRAVLDAYLAGRIALGGRGHALASVLEVWPESSSARARALRLVPELDPHALRRLLPGWLAALARDEPDAAETLRAIDQDRLIPIAREQVRRGDLRLLGLLRRSDSLALRTLVDELRPSHAAAIAHLITPDEPPPQSSPVDDPIAGLEPEALIATITTRGVEVGLAVRAVHALAESDAGPDAIEPFVIDRRPRVRSAALRALRALVERERYLDAVTRVLAIETRDDVIVSLLASLGHARHPPGLPGLIEHLVGRDTKLRAGAEAALLAWGSTALPGLRRAAAKARPDHARTIAALIERLEADA